MAAENTAFEPIIIAEQGSFAVGGTVLQQGEASLHGDHLYAFYQKPVDARKYPLVFWHGADQTAKTWETTPDGREGFQTLFLRWGYSVYLLDQPRRGRAGRSTVEMKIEPYLNDAMWFDIFRVGTWPNYFDGVQFSKDPAVLDQYLRSISPNTGPFDRDVAVAGVSALLDKIGPSILVTHSQSGGLGWMEALKNSNVRAIVSYEPGEGYIFPEGEAPEPMPASDGMLFPKTTAMEEFLKFTTIPIVMYYGDNIPSQPLSNPGHDTWRVRFEMAKIWANTVNKHGGDAIVVHLPDLGIRGNTHFPFSDLNNLKIADLMKQFLTEKSLD
ncbi:alpha/beta fold hydrolase [Phyllobacterium sp. YR531]|uniref:alpha/beta hydrolase n=1 Tax=Phyllobacterium sp. YR531 TaxID=1144343 RepID=UPI001FCBF91A|nr:alpha/beta fold hydrolase [Phyllobacterium sp. YR531]